MTIRRVLALTSVITLIGFLSRILGLAREMLMAKQFGAGATTDAYSVAAIIPATLIPFVTTSLSTSLLPVYSERLQGGTEGANRFASSVLNGVAVISTVAAVVCIAGAHWIVTIIAPGFPTATMSLSVRLAVILAPMIPLLTISGVVSGILQSHSRFVSPAFSAVAQNIIMLISLALFAPHFGIMAVAGGLTVGAAAQLLVQLPFLMKTGFKYKFVLNIHEAGLGQLFRLSVPALLTVVGLQGVTIVERAMASTLPPGSISALDYANRVYSLPGGVLFSAVTTTWYTVLCTEAARGEMGNFREWLEKGARITVLLAVPTMIVIAGFSEPIVRLLFERGKFSTDATHMTAAALFMYVPTIGGSALLDLWQRGYYALHDTKTPMYISYGKMVLNLVLDVILIRSMAHVGFALASSISTLAAAWALRVLLYSRTRPDRKTSQAGLDHLKIYASGGLMALTIILLQTILPRTGLADVAIRGAVSTGVYVACLLLFRVPELRIVSSLITTRFKGLNRDVREAQQ